MKHKLLATGASLAFAAGFALAAPSAAVAEDQVSDPAISIAEATPAVATPEGAAAAIYVDENGQPLELDENGRPLVEEASSAEDASISTASASCTPTTGVDNPHISTWSTGPAVQAHGWWNKGTCEGGTADVTVCLYEYYTSGTSSYWERKNCATKNLKPGGGSSYRVTAHEDCDNRTNTSWRAHVDVDVDWEIDTSEQGVRQAIVDCRVF